MAVKDKLQAKNHHTLVQAVPSKGRKALHSEAVTNQWATHCAEIHCVLIAHTDCMASSSTTQLTISSHKGKELQGPISTKLSSDDTW